MKQIIIALGLIAIMHSGAEAQTCNCKCKKVIKHASTIRAQRPKPVAQPANTPAIQSSQTLTESCRVVPYQVCSINPDRRSVSCYKTIDPDDEQPYSDEVTTYGATGEIPGQSPKPTVETIIINGPAKADYCKRNKEDNATICYSSGLLTRDEFGFYHYK